MIIDAVIYGPTPSITIESFEIPPPENTSKRLKNWLPARSWARLWALIPGIGIVERSRKTTRAPKVKKIRFRIAGSFTTVAIFWKIEFIVV
jgi:hypothetical protein